MAPPKTKDASRGTVLGTVLSGLVDFTLRAAPLPSAITDFLLSHTSSMANMLSQREHDVEEDERSDARDAVEGTQERGRTLTSEQFWAELESLLHNIGGEWTGAADRVWGFGPRRMGANLLLDPVGKKTLRFVFSEMTQYALISSSLRGKEQLIAAARAQGKSADEALAATDDTVAQTQLASISADESEARAELRLLRDFENSVEAGFQMATFQGPLCAEPVVGMGWVVERIEFNREEEQSEQGM